MFSRRVLLQSLCCVVLISCQAFAGDPSGRVARLNYMSGQVSIQPNGVNDWVAGNVNRPLTSSDRVWTDKDSRAELQLGAASARLNGETSLTLANVSDRAVQLQLDQGSLNLHVVRLFDGEIYEIDTPNLAFTVEKPGDYRLDVDNAGDTTVVTVWKGRGEATGDAPGVRIGSKQQFTFSGGRSLHSAVTNAPGFDGFDSWCKVRAQREDRSLALRYVSPYAVGYSDLDEYGRWETIPPYGPVWIPANVAVGWAPYRWGHWVFIAPWGWTWVDDSPWGFAPYHYGRWVYYHNYWGWCPGPIYARPIYAPALVGWVGGPRFGFGLSFGIGGGVGWFPLGWGEPYVPWYGGSRRYFQNVNVSNTHITNITYVTNNYYGGHPIRPVQFVNQHPYAVSAVPNETFSGSRPTRGTLVPVSSETLRGASVVNSAPVRPTRESMMGPSQHMTAPPSAVFHRPVVTRMTPPAASAGPNVNAAEVGSPGRPVAATPMSTAVANETMSRPSREVPRPPAAMASGAPSAEQSPRAIAHPPQSVANSSALNGEMPARVPRPPLQGTSAAAAASSESNSRRVAVPNSMATPGQRPTPEVALANSQRVGNERPESLTPTTTAREYPHPTAMPAPAPSNVSREERPVMNSQETRSTPPSMPTRSAPASTSSPAAAPHASQPAHESHQENKPEKSATPHSDLSYPSPYNGNGAVQPASYARTVPRPTGPVAPAPQVNQSNYSANHNAGGATRNYSQPNYSPAHSNGSGSPSHASAPAMHASSHGSVTRSAASSPHSSGASHSSGHASGGAGKH